MGALSLGAGVHTLRMSRPIHESAQDTLALFVDTVILSSDPAFDPAETSEWLPLMEMRAEVPAHVSSGAFRRHDAGLPGAYRCWVTVSDEERLVDWDGEAGARSNEVEFVVSSQ
jgi:hypothetical protein